MLISYVTKGKKTERRTMIKQKMQKWESGIRNYIQPEKRQALHRESAKTCMILEKTKMRIPVSAIETTTDFCGTGVAIGEA